MVVEVEGGITVYPARRAGDRWRAVWYEGGRRRQCEAVAEDKLALKLARVAERLAADAPGLERPGADLIAWYLSPDRHPAGRAWSRKHADTQRRLCERFIAPVIAAVCCQDIRVADMQRIVNAAPTAGEGARLRRCLSAMVTAGIAAGYLTSPRLKEVHWQAAGRAAPGPQVAVAGESALFVDPAEIPADHDVARLGRALAAGRRGDLGELMASTAAYTGLRQGELFALTAAQVAPAARVITVDRKVVEVAGTLYLEAPKGRKRRSTIYPARTPAGYPLADRLAARAGQARAEQDAGTNPLGLMFPSPRGTWWRSSNFDRRVLAPAYQAAGWRDPHGDRRLDLAQPAARVLHHRPVRLAPRTRRRLLHGRPRQHPRHPRHVRRRHRRRPGPRPHRHPIAPGRPLLRRVNAWEYRGRTGRAKRRLGACALTTSAPWSARPIGQFCSLRTLSRHRLGCVVSGSACGDGGCRSAEPGRRSGGLRFPGALAADAQHSNTDQQMPFRNRWSSSTSSRIASGSWSRCHWHSSRPAASASACRAAARAALIA